MSFQQSRNHPFTKRTLTLMANLFGPMVLPEVDTVLSINAESSKITRYSDRKLCQPVNELLPSVDGFPS